MTGSLTVATDFGIRLVRASQTVEWRTVGIGDFPVQIVLAYPFS
jgi:hypothetical protein